MSDENEPVQDAEAGEQFIPFDPKEVEAELIRQAEARAEDPIESAAMAYQMYVPHFKRLLPKISTRGLRRVLQYLVLYPLEKESVTAASEFEKQFMQLVNSLVEAKVLMVLDSYRQNAEALYAAQQNPLTPDEQAGVIKDLRAGGVSEEEIERLTKQNEIQNEMEQKLKNAGMTSEELESVIKQNQENFR